MSWGTYCKHEYEYESSQRDYVRVVDVEESDVFSSTGAASERLTAQMGVLTNEAWADTSASYMCC